MSKPKFDITPDGREIKGQLRFLIHPDYALLDKIYKLCKEYNFIANENKYVVIGHSLHEIQYALSTATNYSTYFINGRESRKWIKESEIILNKQADKDNLITITIIGYIEDIKKIDNKKYNNVIKCVDMTWHPYTDTYHKSNNNLHVEAGYDCYFFSGQYLFLDEIKLSFAFFKDNNLASSVQNIIHYTTNGFSASSLIKCKKLINNNKLQKKYKHLYNECAIIINNFKSIITEYNEFAKEKLTLTIEPSNWYIFVKSKNMKSIYNFVKYYDNIKQSKIPVLSKKYQLHQYDTYIDNGVVYRCAIIFPQV